MAFGGAASKLFARINMAHAARVVGRAGAITSGNYGRLTGMGFSRMVAGRESIRQGAIRLGGGLRNWAWTGQSPLTRAARMGTVIGGVGTARNILDPRNNWGPF